MTPRLTVGECDICGKKAYIGRLGDPVCTDACASLRSYHRMRDAQTRTGLRGLLADARTLDPEAKLRAGRHGFYIAAHLGGHRLRIEVREDLDWLLLDLERSAA